GDVFDQVCTGVAAAHAVSIIHRDLKPENIILCQREDRILVKILDFGIARVDARSGQSRTGFGLGTIAYMAPEQAVGAQSQIAPATDVFALGVILAEMLSLCPYPSRELGVNEPWWALIMRDEGIARSRLASLCGHVPAAVRDVVITALRREPIKRYDVAGNMRRAFRASLSGAPPANAAATPATALHGGNMESRTMPLPAPPAQRAAVASDAPGGSVAGATVPTPAPASVLPQRRAMRVAGSVMGLGCMVVLAFAARRSFAPGRPSTESAEVLPAISLAPSSASSPVSLSATAAPSASSDTSSPAASAATAAPSASSDTPPPVAPRTNEGTAPAVAESTGESGQPQARATNPVTATNPVLPKGVAGEFDRAAASTTLDAAAATAKSCGRTDGPTGTGTISVTFDPSGRATSAQVQGPPFAGTAVGACINEVFHRTARAPPFRGSPVVVTRAFMVPWRPDSL
ncbi:MAG TPA: protein kinase, partial [Sorangium sp.]|nr:protein kinase [Sorangium sp.]